MIKELLHIGIGVKDLEKSVWFYTEVMGMEEEYRTRNRGEKISRIVNVENADLDVCVVKNDRIRIELLDYKNDRAKMKNEPIRQDEPGLIHIAFLVDDVDYEYERIKGLGFEFHAPPMVARENGPKITYFRGPDNVIIEIFEKVT